MNKTIIGLNDLYHVQSKPYIIMYKNTMKTFKKIFGIGLMAFFITITAPHKSMAQEGGYVSDQEFYDNLQQYGTWVDDPNYGNVWVPDVDGDFRPYATEGHWVQTEYGSTWVSDYPWGWATFHYGRWHYDNYYGWEWVPGHEWAPAWVSWRHGGGYYGWAPLGPGITIAISLGSGYRVPNNYWVCAPEAYINRPNIYNYYAPPTRVVTIINRTTIVHNTYIYNNRTYVTGPRPQEIQRITRQQVQVYKINNASRPGVGRVENNSINIYRPAIRKSPDARPARVVNATAYKQANPNQGIGRPGAGAYNHENAQRLAATARSENPNNKVVRVNPANNQKPGQPANNNRPGQPAVKPNPQQPATGANNGHGRQPATGANQAKPANGGRPAQAGSTPTEQNKLDRQNANDRRAPGAVVPKTPETNNAAQKQQQDQARQQQQAQQRQQKQTQQTQQRQQQQAQQKQQQDQARQQQQTQQRQQQQAQQAQQKQQQQTQQRQQQQAQQAQQKQQQQAQQRQQQQAQQAQQRQQQQSQQRQQQQAQQAQQKQQQQAQQRQQQQAQQAQQRQQQQAQQHQQQQAQQAQQKQQQQAQQRQQQQKQQQQKQQPKPQPHDGG